MNSKNFDPDALKRATRIIEQLPDSNPNDAPKEPVAPPNEYLDGILASGPPGKTGSYIKPAHVQFLWAPPPEIQGLLREPLVALKEDKVFRPGNDNILPQPAGYPKDSLTFGPPGQGKTSGIFAAAREMAVREEAKRDEALRATIVALDEMSAIFAENFEQHGTNDSSNRLSERELNDRSQNQPVDTPKPDGTNDSFGM